MMPIWWGLGTGLTGIVAVTDWRGQVIPNRWSGLGAGLVLMGILTGALPATRLLWGMGTWGAYELSLWWQPGSVGWGDVKWASFLMALFGGLGLLMVGAGHAGSLLWGTCQWAREGRHRPWRQYGGPWAPGAFAGCLLLGSAFFVSWH